MEPTALTTREIDGWGECHLTELHPTSVRPQQATIAKRALDRDLDQMRGHKLRISMHGLHIRAAWAIENEIAVGGPHRVEIGEPAQVHCQN